MAGTAAKPGLGAKVFFIVHFIRDGVRPFAVGLIREAECRRIEFGEHAKLMPGEDRRTSILYAG